jgi:hypothetical protein
VAVHRNALDFRQGFTVKSANSAAPLTSQPSARSQIFVSLLQWCTIQ